MTIKCQNLGLNYIDSYSRLLHVRSGEFIKNRYKMIFKYAHDHREISKIYFYFVTLFTLFLLCSVES